MRHWYVVLCCWCVCVLNAACDCVGRLGQDFQLVVVRLFLRVLLKFMAHCRNILKLLSVHGSEATAQQQRLLHVSELL